VGFGCECVILEAHCGEGDLGDRVEVEVLLATFNGARFLREQIESILAQDYEAVRLLACDDGSHDGTVEILAEYAEKHPDRFRVLTDDEPSGSAKANFLRLMQAATADYVCFADQDDVWLPGKVRRSIEVMKALEEEHGRATPLLVFSDLRVVDDQLKTIHHSMWKQMEIAPESAARLERLIGRSVVTGCTATINRSLLELARQMPEEATLHDRWIGLLAAAMGKTAFLREQTVLYRQHGSNVIGATAPDNSVTGTIVRAQHDAGRRAERRRCEQEAEALLRLHGAEMPKRQSDLLRAYLRSGRSRSAVERVVTTLRYGFFRPGLLRSLALIWDLARTKSDERLSSKERPGS